MSDQATNDGAQPPAPKSMRDALRDLLDATEHLLDYHIDDGEAWTAYRKAVEGAEAALAGEPPQAPAPSGDGSK